VTAAEVSAKARRIRLLVLDVDGVLTDGRIYLTERGEELKVFDVRDGSGIVAIREAGIRVAIISGRSSAAVDRRARELGIEHVAQGVRGKGPELDALLARLAVSRAEIACVGDDTGDLPIFERSGLGVAVADAHADVIARADWVTTRPGGRGAVREVCDLLLNARR
jgi:3-deoxy-D-manno-octulosonate 8-phosphate phosphatase (KDO 8-P phosphatase)